MQVVKKKEPSIESSYKDAKGKKLTIKIFDDRAEVSISKEKISINQSALKELVFQIQDQYNNLHSKD